MRLSRIFFIIAAIGIVMTIASCAAVSKIKGSVSGTVYNNGRPLMGQIQVIDPKTFGSITTQPVNNQGHFIISDVPPGEWILAFLGPSSNPLGEYKYVKVRPGRPETGLVYELTEVDPKVQELLDRIKTEQAEGEAPTKQ